MAEQTPLEIVAYYEGLLIAQYANLPNAVGTIGATVAPIIICQTSVQTVSFSSAATSGAFVLSYNGNSSASINWNDSLSTVQGKLQAISGLSAVTVSGSISSQLIVTFVNVIPPAFILSQVSNTLSNGSGSVSISIAETDETLPLAVVNSFNFVSGSVIASGVQLDVIGAYAGVTRNGVGFLGQSITLNDADFTVLIRIAIIKNSSGSSLATIQSFIHQFFANQMYVIDYANMTMTYVISQAIGSNNLLQLFISEGLLPRPMAVQITAIINPPNLNLFSFRTYELPAPPSSSPFNTYASYNLNYPWLSYQYVIG